MSKQIHGAKGGAMGNGNTMSRAATLATAAAAIAAAVAGCGPAHTGAYVEKHREYTVDTKNETKSSALSDGSLWQDGRPASMLFTDARALHGNDLVVIKVEEIASANRSANTNMTRESTAAAKVDAFLGLLTKLQKAGLDPNLNLGGSSTSSFKGQGQSDRSEYLTATVPALVRKVLPNGNLFVEGHRVVLVNNEEQHFYISGVVRPIDIDQDNSVKSSIIADAQIEFDGAGDLSDNQKQGFLSRYFGWLWPF